jgi:taurine dioxygenase
MPRNEARTYRHIEVVPVSGSLGAEIRGVNVAAALDDTVIGEIRRALLDHLVVVFREP